MEMGSEYIWLTNILIVSSFICLLVSFWHRNDLPRDIETLAALVDEPRQTATRKDAFTAVYNDVEYLVEPEYDYDLHGMVVSCIGIDRDLDGTLNRD